MIGRGLYAILDLDRLAGRPISPLAVALLRGGAAAIQVRAKNSGARALLAAARQVLPLCVEAGRPFVVNDRPDVARIVGAWGVHVGQGDLSVADARAVSPGAKVGASTHSEAELGGAIASGADYVGYGPVFATATKENPDPVQGLDALREAVRRSPVPLVAIGGIDAGRAADVARAGARAAAAIAAVDQAADPEGLARAFSRAFEEAA